MFDPISQSLAAVGARSAYAPVLVAVAGVVSSIGPCVAPRLIAVAGLSAGKSRVRALGLVSAFVAGLTAAYAAFGAVSSLLGRATQLSTYIYVIVAAVLAVGGIITLWRGQNDCAHAHQHPSKKGSIGGALLLGASFALVVSPCCTPLVLGILAYTSAAGSPAYGSGLLACFALGHALPIVAVAFGMNGMTAALQRYGIRQAAGVISATLMLGLAGYYAVLA